MPRRPRLAALLALALAPTPIAAADTLTWDGELAPNLSWIASSGGVTNWDRDEIPGATSDCIVPSGLVRADGLLQEARTLVVDGTLDLLGGRTLRLGESGIIASGTIGGFLECPGPVGFTGDLTFGGTLRGGGTFTSSGSLATTGGFVGDTTAPRVPSVLVNQGPMQVSGILRTVGASSLENDGAITLDGDLGGDGRAINRGTIRLEDGGLSLIGNLEMESGTITAASGELRLVGENGLTGGELLTESSGLLSILSNTNPTTFAGLSRIAGDGPVELSSGPTPLMTVTGDLDWEVGEPFIDDVALTLWNTLTVEATVRNRGRARWRRGALLGSGELRNESLAELEISDVAGPIGARLVNDSGEVRQRASLQESPDGRPEIVNDGLGLWILNRGDLAFLSEEATITNRGLMVKRDLPGSTAQPSGLVGTIRVEGGEVRVESSTLTVAGSGEWTDATLSAEGASSLLRLDGFDHRFAGASTLEGDGRIEIVPILSGQADLELTSGAVLRNELPAAGREAPQPCLIAGDVTFTGDGMLMNVGGMDVVSTDLDAETRNEGRLRFRVLPSIVRDPFRNDGEVLQETDLDLREAGTVTNEGLWSLVPGKGAINGISSFAPARFVNGSEGVLTCEPGTTGAVNGLDNLAGGLVIAASELRLFGFTNAGTMIARGARLTLFGTSTNDGIVIAEAGGVADVEFLPPPPLSLDAGAWIAMPGGRIEFPSALTEVAGAGRLRGGTTSIPALTGLERIGAGGDVMWTEIGSSLPSPLLVDVDGAMEIGDLSVTSIADVMIAGDDVGAGEVSRSSDDTSGAGASGPAVLVTPTLENAGRLRLGAADDHGVLRLEGDLVQTSIGRLIATIGGAGAPGVLADQLEVVGDASFAGTLQIDLDPGYEPEAGTSFTLATSIGGTFTGAFDAVDAEGRWTVDVHPIAVLATYDGPSVPGDVDGDGLVGFTDLVALLAAWGDCPGCPADLDGDGTVGFGDLLILLPAWT